VRPSRTLTIRVGFITLRDRLRAFLATAPTEGATLPAN
jgi:hypothetical protein